MASEENFMRAPAPTPKRTVYTEAMEIFHRAADLIGLDKRVRLELEEPDYEHIFYVTAKLKDRLVPLAPEQARDFADLSHTQVRNPEGLERLADGKIILNGRALLGSDVSIRRGHLCLPDGHVYQLVPGESQRFKAYRVQQQFPFSAFAKDHHKSYPDIAISFPGVKIESLEDKPKWSDIALTMEAKAVEADDPFDKDGIEHVNTQIQLAINARGLMHAHGFLCVFITFTGTLCGSFGSTMHAPSCRKGSLSGTPTT